MHGSQRHQDQQLEPALPSDAKVAGSSSSQSTRGRLGPIALALRNIARRPFPPSPDDYAAAFSPALARELDDLTACARKAVPERPSISHACAVSPSSVAFSPCATFGSPGTATRMIYASPSPSATSCTRQSTSPFTSVRGAHASRGLPSSYCRSGSAAATTKNFNRLVSIGSLMPHS